MNANILVSAAELERLLNEAQCLVVDCRFELSDPRKGRGEWLAGHVPGAAYANLDDNLSSPVHDHTGRHPLPDPGRFAAWLASIGWAPGTLLVAYDEGSNALAARLWWLMRYFGYSSALLDGGLAAWVASGRPLEAGEPERQGRESVSLKGAPQLTVDTATILEHLGSGELQVLDARAGPRFSGDVEPLDSRGGHIPGALNRPFGSNLEANGRFKPPGALREEFAALLGGRRRESVVHSCGSGVTACHNLFAMELAGLTGSRLYPGSWSEWIRDPDRPIETGA
jgi:thiosulfate/3-mercaptopyruvate sulfurtransferase